MVVKLRQCCCFCTLKTGTIIIGVLNAIGGLVTLIQGITAASVANVAAGVVLAVMGAILLFFAICLIVAAEKDNPVLLMPWMVYTVVFLILETVLYIIIAAQYFKMGLSYEGAVSLVVAVIYILLETYFLLVVYSLFREVGWFPGPPEDTEPLLAPLHNKQTTQQHRRGQ